MNKHLFELLRRIEDSARRLATTIMHNSDKRLRDIASVEVEIKEISDALEGSKARLQAVLLWAICSTADLLRNRAKAARNLEGSRSIKQRNFIRTSPALQTTS